MHRISSITLCLFFFVGFVSPVLAQSEDDRIDVIKSLLYQNPDSAEAICMAMLEEQEDLSTSELLQVHRFMGIILDLRGEYEASLDAYDQVLKFEIEEDDSVHWANAKLGKGVIYHRLGQFDKALDLYRTALSYYERNQLNDRVRSTSGNIAALYNNLGLYQEAIDIYFIQLDDPEVQNDTDRCAAIYLNLANSFEQKGELDSAIYYNNRSIELHRSIDDIYGLGSNYHTKATLYKHLGMLDSALHYYELCISPTEGIYYKYNLTSILILMAETYYLQQKHDIALIYTDSVYNLINDSEEYAVLAGLHNLEAKIFEEKGDQEQAAQAWKQAFLALEKNDKQILDARLLRFSQETKATYYENVLAKKTAENSALISENERKAKYIFWFLLGGCVLVAALISFYIAWWNHKRYNRVLSERNRDLDEHLQTKKNLLSLLAHDFRSPLKSMYSMLDFFDKDELSSEERKLFIKRARRHIQTTLRGMDQMLVWITRDKKKPSIEKVKLKPMIEHLLDFFHLELEEKHMQVNYEELEDGEMQFDHGNLEAIVRNVLSNCIKYCPDGSQIDINYAKTSAEESLSIHDNGPGIDPETLNLIASQKFNELQPKSKSASTSTGVGMELIFDLASLNGAKVVVDSAPNQGTSISIIRGID